LLTVKNNFSEASDKYTNVKKRCDENKAHFDAFETLSKNAVKSLQHAGVIRTAAAEDAALAEAAQFLLTRAQELMDEMHKALCAATANAAATPVDMHTPASVPSSARDAAPGAPVREARPAAAAAINVADGDGANLGHQLESMHVSDATPTAVKQEE